MSEMEEKEVLSSAEKEDIRRRNLSPVERTREEFLETEESYVSGLRIIVKVYLQGIKDMNLIGPKDIETIFANITTIHQIHEQLLEDLKNLINTNRSITDKTPHQSFGDLLKGFIPFLKMYTVYVNGFNEANRRMQRLQRSSKKFAAFLKVRPNLK